MFLRLLLLLTFIPLVELAILIWIGNRTNWQTAVLLGVLPGAVGALLIRRAGVSCLQTIRSQLGRGELPADALADALFILVAGALLLTPGVLTDLAGLLLLLPWSRSFARRHLLGRLRAEVSFWTDDEAAEDRIIDVRVKNPDDEP